MAIKTWLGGIGTFGYDSGSDEPTVGDVITGTSSGAFGLYVSTTITGGSWAGDDAAGVMTIRAISGTFTADEVLINTTQSDTDIATVDLDGTAFTDSSGDFNIAANWSTAVVPADGDTLLFNIQASLVPASFADTTFQTVGKSFSVSGTLDQSAKDFPLIKGDKNFTGGIGYGLVSTTYHALRCAAGMVIWAGEGDFHLVAQHATEDIDKIIFSSANGNLYLGKGSSNGQVIVDVTQNGKNVELLAAESGTLAAPELNKITCISNSGTTTLASDNSSSTLVIKQTNGTVTAKCNIADVEVMGGTFKWGLSDFEPAAAKTIDSLLLLAGNVFWDMAGTISLLKAYSGNLALTGSGAKVVGDAAVNSGTIEVHAAALDFTNESDNISLAANAEVVVYNGGTFKQPLASDGTFS